MFNDVKPNLWPLAVGLGGTAVSVFSSSLQEWSAIGAAVGTWLGVLVALLTAIKIVVEIRSGFRVIVLPSKDKKLNGKDKSNSRIVLPSPNGKELENNPSRIPDSSGDSPG